MYTIRIISKEIEYDGKKFCAFKTKENGKWIDVKFTQDCEKVPKKTGKYIIEVPKDKINMSTKGFYPVLWIKEITLIKENEKKVTEFNFNDDLPF